MNAQIIALVNQRGGVGKSTSCANLGVGLAQAGKKVLQVDVDPQASLTISLGHPQPVNLPVTLSDMMGKVLNDQTIAPGKGILHYPEGVNLMPSEIKLPSMEVSLVNAMSRETILQQYLDTAHCQYSHCRTAYPPWYAHRQRPGCGWPSGGFCPGGILFGQRIGTVFADQGQGAAADQPQATH